MRKNPGIHFDAIVWDYALRRGIESLILQRVRLCIMLYQHLWSRYLTLFSAMLSCDKIRTLKSFQKVSFLITFNSTSPTAFVYGNKLPGYGRIPKCMQTEVCKVSWSQNAWRHIYCA